MMCYDDPSVFHVGVFFFPFFVFLCPLFSFNFILFVLPGPLGHQLKRIIKKKKKRNSNVSVLCICSSSEGNRTFRTNFSLRSPVADLRYDLRA